MEKQSLDHSNTLLIGSTSAFLFRMARINSLSLQIALIFTLTLTGVNSFGQMSCFEIFSDSNNQHRHSSEKMLFQTPNAFFDSLPREWENSRERHSLGYFYWALPFSTEKAETVPATWQEMAAYLQPGVIEARCPECKSPQTSRMAVASVIARAHQPLPHAGEPFSLETLQYQAKILGADISTEQSSFRLDQRPPDQIAQTGFQPNPNKKSMTYWDHLRPDSTGSGNLVSLTLQQGNNSIVGTVLSSFISTRENVTGFFSNKLESIFVDSQTQKPITTNVVIYEYAIGEIQGVRTPNEYGVGKERELIVPQVSPDQVAYYRAVEVSVKKGVIKSIRRSNWARMRNY